MIKFLFFLLVGVPAALTAQYKNIFDTSFINNTSDDFFCINPDIDSIKVDRGYRRSKSLSVFVKSVDEGGATKKSRTSEGEYFDMDFLGDEYLFEKKYGKLNLPTNVMQYALTKSLNQSCRLQTVLRRDSIRCFVECYFQIKTGDDEDKIFTKVERGPKYVKGVQQLQNQIKAALKLKYPDGEKLPIDSVLIYKIMVDRKDSCLLSIELEEGKSSRFAQIVSDEIKSACSWTPANGGGRPVMAYLKMFVRLNKNNSITVDIPIW